LLRVILCLLLNMQRLGLDAYPIIIDYSLFGVVVKRKGPTRLE